ncbi:MAG: TolC family protein [Candidatus Marinimicrobia bacterium]|nr:TolC family protein [Candidatus Neomarinimicrobiota bacterium]
MRKVLITILFIISIAISGEKKLTLGDCIQIALEKNPEMSIANKQLKAVQEGVKASYGGTQNTGGILPYISTNYSVRQDILGPTDMPRVTGQQVIGGDTTTYYYNANINLHQNIYDGGKWWNSIKLAKNTYKGAVVDRDLTRQLMIVNVTEKFYDVLKAQELLKVYSKSLENSQEQLKKTRELHRIGQVAKKDLFKAQVREGNDRLNVIQQKSMLKSAISDLSIAMGLAPNEHLEVYEKTYQKPESIDPGTAERRAFENNLELNSLTAQKQSAFLNYKIAKGDRYPTLSSSFSYSRGGSELSRTYSELDKWWNTSLNLNLSYPLFDGFRRKTNIQQKLLNYKIYNDQIEKKKMDIQNLVQNLLLALETYKEMIEINELNIQSAQEDLRLAQEMYRLNSATLLEVLDAQVELTRARGNLVTTKYDAKIAEVQLALVMGIL